MSDKIDAPIATADAAGVLVVIVAALIAAAVIHVGFNCGWWG